MQYKFALPFAVVLMTFGCREDVDLQSPSEFDPMQQPTIVDIGYSDTDNANLPVAILTLSPQLELSFYAWTDRSAGVLSAAESGALDYLNAPELSGKSATEVFWALSTPGTAVPSALVEYQDTLAAEEGHLRWEELIAQPQGWGLGIQFLRVHANCVNSVFTSNHCLPASPYTHDVCKTDTNSNWSWTTGATRNYKAGFCLDSGTVNDTLTYSVQAGDCTYFRSLNYVWGDPLNGGNVYNANTYLSWVWAASATTPSRKWHHVSSNGGGTDNYDWAIRQLPGSICGG